MTSRQINLVLWSATAALGVSTAVAIVSGLMVPLALPAQAQANTPGSGRPVPTTAPVVRLELAALDRPLRLPLSDAAPAPADQAATSAMAAQGAAPFALVGTIGDSVAMFRMPDGSISVKEMGDQINGATVLAVRPAQADVMLNGTRTTLEKIKPSEGGP
jgi:hypothetical protein